MPTYKEIYDSQTGNREGFLDQARDHSRLTIPSLIPPDGSDTSSYNELYKPYQSLGAFGVNSLSNKLAGALYPTSEPFFKFDVATTSEELEGVTPQGLDAIDTELAVLEKTVLRKFIERGDRAAITEAIKHLVVAGNALLFVGEEKTTVYSLDKYIAIRDGSGNLLKVITKDTLSYDVFRESHPELTEIHARHQGNRNYVPKEIDVYTCMERRDGKWYVQEEAAGKRIASTESMHPLTEPPYLALRFNIIYGQAYGRGYVENLFGDLISYESLSQSMVEGAAINARCIAMVDPNGFTSAKTYEEAPNGGVITGRASDVAFSRVEKSADLSVTASEIARLESRLEQAFMLAAATQRDAERVTATEVTMVTKEVEQILGGVYNVLSEEFQKPYVARLMRVLGKTNQIPELPEGIIDVVIVTGAAGIGRGIDGERLVTFIGTTAEAVGREVIAEYVNLNIVLARLAASFGIDMKGLIKTPEEIAQQQQQAQDAQMTQALGPQAIQAAGQVTAAQVKQQQQPQPGAAPDGNQEVPVE